MDYTTDFQSQEDDQVAELFQDQTSQGTSQEPSQDSVTSEEIDEIDDIIDVSSVPIPIPVSTVPIPTSSNSKSALPIAGENQINDFMNAVRMHASATANRRSDRAECSTFDRRPMDFMPQRAMKQGPINVGLSSGHKLVAVAIFNFFLLNTFSPILFYLNFIFFSQLQPPLKMSTLQTSYLIFYQLLYFLGSICKPLRLAPTNM